MGMRQKSMPTGLARLDYARYAQILGLRVLTLDNPNDMSRIWTGALSCVRPVVIDAKVDPSVLALPRNLKPSARQRRKADNTMILLEKPGAGERIRTVDPNLGKVMLYP
jgi:thiamine pyrophosphate-dependent acetolactate synthase large subunit-like protein